MRRTKFFKGPGRCDRRELEKTESLRAGVPLPVTASWDNFLENLDN
jgi:hypothetical protein